MSVNIPDCCKNCQFRLGRCRTLHSEDGIGFFPARQRSYSRDTTLYEAGVAPGLVGILKSGFLRKERIYGDGRRTIFGLSRPGEIVGRAPGVLSDVSVEAATDVEICLFDSDAVTRLMKTNDRFRLDLLSQAAMLHNLQLDMVWLRGALSSRERVIAFIVMMAGFMPSEPLPDGSIIVTIELSRRDWADMSNSTVETISRTMTELSENGKVETVAPNRYRITDLKTLAASVGMTAPK